MAATDFNDQMKIYRERTLESYLTDGPKDILMNKTDDILKVQNPYTRIRNFYSLRFEANNFYAF